MVTGKMGPSNNPRLSNSSAKRFGFKNAEPQALAEVFLTIITTVNCSKCQRPFRVEGSAGTLKKVTQGVGCPYEGCFAMNEVEWSIDGSFSSVAIPKAMSTHGR